MWRVRQHERTEHPEHLASSRIGRLTGSRCLTDASGGDMTLGRLEVDDSVKVVGTPPINWKGWWQRRRMCRERGAVDPAASKLCSDSTAARLRGARSYGEARRRRLICVRGGCADCACMHLRYAQTTVAQHSPFLRPVFCPRVPRTRMCSNYTRYMYTCILKLKYLLP